MVDLAGASHPTDSVTTVEVTVTPLANGGNNPDWIDEKFGKGRNLAAIAGDNADPDGDGVVNLLEYFMGLDPLLQDATNVMSVEYDEDANALVCTYLRSKTAADVRGGVEASSDGTTWDTEGITRKVIEDLGHAFVVEARVEVDDAEVRKFLRLKVEK